MKQKPQHHLDRQGKHGEHEEKHDRILQEAHALVILWVLAPEEGVQREAAQCVKAAHHHRSEDRLYPVGGYSEEVRQITVDLIDEAVVVPGLSGPEPLPPRSANEGSDDDHRDPQHNKAEEECPDGKLALLPRVVAAA